MSKLDGYTDTDKKIITHLMHLFVHAKMERGELPEDEAVIKAEMPKTFVASKMYIDTVNSVMSRYANFDPSDAQRVRAISVSLFQGAIMSNEVTHDMQDQEVERISKELVRDSVQTVNAVAEYLCG